MAHKRIIVLGILVVLAAVGKSRLKIFCIHFITKKNFSVMNVIGIRLVKQPLKTKVVNFVRHTIIVALTMKPKNKI